MDMFVEAGCDVLQLDQPTLMGIEWLGKNYGGKICFWNPVDIQTTIGSGQPEHHPGGEVHELVAHTLEQLAEICIPEEQVRVDVHHDADDARSPGRERPGGEVGPVSGLRHDVLNPAAGLVGDGATVDDAGDCRPRHAAQSRQLVDGSYHPAASPPGMGALPKLPNRNPAVKMMLYYFAAEDAIPTPNRYVRASSSRSTSGASILP
jgi:hypothetical protein